MAPERQRVSKVSSSRANETSPSSEDEKKKWEETLGDYQRRPIIQERGMVVEPPFEEYIKKQGWTKFVDAKNNLFDGIKETVQEIYMVFHLKGKNRFKMNGHIIDFSAEAINAFFGLTVTGEDEYTAFLQSEYDVQDVMRELTGQERNLMPNWTKFLKAWLVPKTRLLNLFVSSRLMPVSCHSSVAKRRALLIYAICKGITINVGRIINAELHNMTKASRQAQTIGFPSLITTLCVRGKGVQSFDTFDLVTLMKDIRMQDFIKGGSPEEEAGHEHAENPEGSENELANGEELQQRVQAQDIWELNEKVDALQAELRQHNEKMSAIQQELNQHTEEFHAHRDTMDTHRESVHAFMRYTVDFHTWLASGQPGPPPTLTPPPPKH